MTNSEKLRALIEKAGITQREAAETLDVDESTLRRWLMSPDKKTAVHCADRYIRLLELELKSIP